MSAKPKRSELRCDVILGDCVEGMLALPEEYAHLIVADPPYNIGMEYDGYDDAKSETAYLAWTQQWMIAAKRVLAKHGTMWIFVPDEWASDVDVLARRTLKLHRRGWVIWAFGFGVACQRNFSRSHCHVLYYTKTKTKFTFNDLAVRVPSDRQAIYNDPRANPTGKMPNDTWLLHKAQIEETLPADGDTWYMSRICGTYHERRAQCPNQIPIPIMERIVHATSNRGDLVVDPFAGTGSLGIAAQSLGRGYVGYDVSKEYVRQIRRRLGLQLPKQRKHA